MSTAKKAALLGWPVEHSLSPRLHGYWLKQYGINGSYQALAVKPDDLAETLRKLAKEGYVGVNLTVPHKEHALSIVDRMDENAKRIGAVNTIIMNAGLMNTDGDLEGRNTDAFGFAQNLLEGGYKMEAERPIAVLGAGGAARAVIAALQDMGAREIHLINRTLEKAEALAQEFSVMEQAHFIAPNEKMAEAVRHMHRVHAYGWGDFGALENAGLLVNATSLGMKGQPPLDVPLDLLPKDAFVTDIVYAPLETDLLKRAKQRGNRTIDGLGMLLHQARPAFEAFFGKDPEVTHDLRAHILDGR